MVVMVDALTDLDRVSLKSADTPTISKSSKLTYTPGLSQSVYTSVLVQARTICCASGGTLHASGAGGHPEDIL